MQLSQIEQIAFQNGQTIAVTELPIEIQSEVQLYNGWTQDALALQSDILKTKAKLNTIMYARQAAFSIIQSLAISLENAQNEAPAQVTECSEVEHIESTPTEGRDSDD